MSRSNSRRLDAYIQENIGLMVGADSLYRLYIADEQVFIANDEHCHVCMYG